MMQKRIISFLILLLEVHSNYGQRISIGSCGNVQPMQNFDIEKYDGTWYTIQEYPTIYSLMADCQKVTYTLSQPNTLHWELTQNSKISPLNKVGGKKKSSPPGKLSVSTDGIPIPSNLFDWNHIILDTDYDQYAVAYSCNTIFNFKIEFAYIYSRSFELNPDITQKAINVFKNKGINVEKLKKNKQANCLYS